MMKKKVLFWLGVCALLVMTMVSCGRGEPQNAQALYDRIDEQMDALDSFRIDMTVNMTLFVDGNEIKGDIQGYMVENKDVEGTYYYCQDATSKITSEKLSLNESISNFEAYYNGNYFISNGEQNKPTQKLYSAMTEEEFLAYRADNDTDTFDFIRDCAEKSFQKREDGTWELICSGYKKAAIEDMSDSMGLGEEMLSSEIMDMTVSILADRQYRATKITLDFVFEESKNTPSISYVMDFSQYNEAEPVQLDYLNVKKFEQVDDIRLLRDVEKMLEERAESESGELTLNIVQILKDSSGKHLSNYTEVNDVSFGEGDEGYFYDIVADVNEDRYNISYQNGIQTVDDGREPQENRQSEQEARDFIGTLINNTGYDASTVTDIEDQGDGVYKLTCGNLQKDVYEAYFKNMGGSVRLIEQIMTVTVKDGKLCEISSSVEAEGLIPSYGTVYMTLSQAVVFQ